MTRWVILLGLSLPALACGDDPENWPDGRPRIDQLVYLQQSPQDPLALQFLIEFTDTDGNLGAGEVHLSVNGDDKAALSLADLFASQSPPVPPDTTVGDFEIVVRINESVEPGSRIEVGFELEDGAGERSNDPSVVLEALE